MSIKLQSLSDNTVSWYTQKVSQTQQEKLTEHKKIDGKKGSNCSHVDGTCGRTRKKLLRKYSCPDKLLQHPAADKRKLNIPPKLHHISSGDGMSLLKRRLSKRKNVNRDNNYDVNNFLTLQMNVHSERRNLSRLRGEQNLLSPLPQKNDSLLLSPLSKENESLLLSPLPKKNDSLLLSPLSKEELDYSKNLENESGLLTKKSQYHDSPSVKRLKDKFLEPLTNTQNHLFSPLSPGRDSMGFVKSGTELKLFAAENLNENKGFLLPTSKEERFVFDDGSALPSSPFILLTPSVEECDNSNITIKGKQCTPSPEENVKNKREEKFVFNFPLHMKKITEVSVEDSFEEVLQTDIVEKGNNTEVGLSGSQHYVAVHNAEKEGLICLPVLIDEQIGSSIGVLPKDYTGREEDTNGIDTTRFVIDDAEMSTIPPASSFLIDDAEMSTISPASSFLLDDAEMSTISPASSFLIINDEDVDDEDLRNDVII